MKLGTYKNLNLGKSEPTKVTKEEVDGELTKLLQSKVSYNTKNGKSQIGDTVNIDYEGFLDGVPFEGGKSEHYDLELGSHSFIPGFEEGLVGFEANSDVDVNVTFPSEYHAPNLAGKAVVFKCHIHEVKTRVEAKLNDDFAREYGLESADALVKELERQMNAKKQNDADNEYLGKLIKEIVDHSEVEIEPDMVEKRTDEIIKYLEQNIGQYGMDINTYLSMSGQTMETLKEQAKAQATSAVKSDLVIAEIAAIEGIVADDAEINATFEQYKNQYGLDNEEFEKFKKKLLKEINALHVEGLPEITRLNALVGKYVNLEYTLPNGRNVKFLDDQTTYLGTQSESEFEGDRYFGVLAGMDFILICTYEADRTSPELVLYKKR